MAGKRFRRHAEIEPVIGHLKRGYQSKRNSLKGFSGDKINLIMTAAASNFKKIDKRDFLAKKIKQMTTELEKHCSDTICLLLEYLK